MFVVAWSPISTPREIELKLHVPVHNLPRLTASSVVKGASKSVANDEFMHVAGRVEAPLRYPITGHRLLLGVVSPSDLAVLAFTIISNLTGT